MIVFLTTRDGSFGIENYLAAWGEPVAPLFRILHYEDLPSVSALPAATYVFSALDQLLPSERVMVSEVRARLIESGACGALLNDPARTLLRFELLERLHAMGRNTFRVVRASERSAPLRFPVFVREANGHDGSLTALLPDRARLGRALFRLRARGRRLEDLLIVEFCDTANEDGEYRKYAAFIVGGRVLPRSLDIGGDWVTKAEVGATNEVRAGEEYDYIATNPHAGRLAETFALAGTDYGRIDYGLLGGRIQTWEINLNPTIAGGRRKPETPERIRRRELIRPARALFHDQLAAAWRAIDCGSAPSELVPWSASGSLRASIEAERRARARHAARRRRRDRMIAARPTRVLRRLLGSG